MFQRKVLRSLAATACLILTMSACTAPHPPEVGGGATASSGAASSESGKPIVLTTFTVIADIASAVAGDHLDIRSITKPGAEIHDYEPTPDDIKQATEADLILENGLGLERWFKQFVQNSNAPTVNLTEGIEPINITEDAYAGQPNPHAWMSPSNVQKYVDHMVEAFSKLDSDHAADFKKNGEDYKAKLQKVTDDMVAELATVPQEQRALVTCEGAFSYLAKDAGLTEGYLWPVNADNEGTPQQVAKTVSFVQEHRVPAVFCESTVNDKAMQQVASETGATFGGVLYVDSLTEAGGEAPTYLDLITYDATTITNALTGKAGK